MILPANQPKAHAVTVGKPIWCKVSLLPGRTLDYLAFSRIEPGLQLVVHHACLADARFRLRRSQRVPLSRLWAPEKTKKAKAAMGLNGAWTLLPQEENASPLITGRIEPAVTLANGSRVVMRLKNRSGRDVGLWLDFRSEEGAKIFSSRFAQTVAAQGGAVQEIEFREPVTLGQAAWLDIRLSGAVEILDILVEPDD